MTTTQLDPSIEAARMRSFAAMGAPGTAVHGGYIVENEKDSRLAGTKKYETYGNILANTSIVAAGVRYFLNLIGKARWKIEPAEDLKAENEKAMKKALPPPQPPPGAEDDAGEVEEPEVVENSSDKAKELAARVDKMLYEMRTPWHRIVRRAAMYKFYGFSIQEWIAERKPDGVIGFRDIKPRPQKTIERWDIATNGDVRGVEQVSPQDGQPRYMPREKIIYIVDDSVDDSPQGLGLFRHLVSRASALERYELLEKWGFERDLRGTPIGRGPLTQLEAMKTAGALSQAQVNELRQPIEDFVQNALKGVDTGMILDSDVYRGTGDSQTPSTVPQWNVELLRGSSTSQPDMAAAIERLNREMARMLGVEHLLLGSDSSGSFALSKDKTQSFGMIVTSTLQEIGEAFETDFLTPLWELNGWPEELKPTMRPEQIQFRDIEQITTALAQLATAGAPLDPEDEAIDEVREMLGLSKHIPFTPPTPGFGEDGRPLEPVGGEGDAAVGDSPKAEGEPKAAPKKPADASVSKGRRKKTPKRKTRNKRKESY